MLVAAWGLRLYQSLGVLLMIMCLQVSGRNKHGGLRVEADTVICEITMVNGTVYPVYR